MDTPEEPPDDLRVRLTWPQPSPSGRSPFNYADEGEEGDQSTVSDLTPPGGVDAVSETRGAAAGQGSGAERAQGPQGRRRRPITRWAAAKRAAAQRAADAREEAARIAAERAAAERAAKRAGKREDPWTGDERGGRAGGEWPDPLRSGPLDSQDRWPAARGGDSADLDAAPRPAAPRPPWDTETRAAGQGEQIPRLAQADAVHAAVERAAAEEAQAQRAAAERAAAERAAAERAHAERLAAERRAVEVAAERAAAEAAARRAEAEARAEQIAAERAAAERAAERAAAERAEAEGAEVQARTAQPASERAGAANAAGRQPPLLTVEAEEDDEEDVHEEPRRPSRPTVTTQELILAGRSDSLQAALASIALRIDALTSTTSTFRNLVSDRITDYAEQVGRLASASASELEDYRHLHERAQDNIRRSVAEAEDNIRRLSRSVGDLDAKVGALIAAVRESGDAVDQLASERDQLSDTLGRGLERVEEGLAELTEGKGASSFARLADIVAALADERDRQDGARDQLEQAILSLADDREHGADLLVRLERVVTELTAARDRGQAKALARLEARVDEIAAAVTGISSEDVTATLSRLDARVKEMSTELVVGRDRETARSLTQLTEQVEGLAALVTEARSDLSPIEARLSRLARRVSSEPPLDLSDVYSRLDEIAELVAQPVTPDLSVFETHVEQLAERALPSPTWAPAMERLERLLPVLEGIRAPAPPPDDTPRARQERQDLLERLDQLGQQLTGQMDALRRRIALRARPPAQELDSDTIAAIADAVVARLSEAPGRRAGVFPPGPPPAVTRSIPGSEPQGPRRGRDGGRGLGST
jgi:uncharacterized protein YoxC